MAPIVLNSMKALIVIFLICLMLAGTASAKAATSSVSSSIANPAISSDIFTTLAYTGCSDDSASVGTVSGMGDLDVDSIPDGASITLDGSLWLSKHCISGYPPVCYSLPVFTPYTGNVEAGTHTITIALSGYKSYSGTVDVCSQKVSYVHKTLSIIPVTAATTTATTTPTTAATTTAATTSAATTSATTAPVTVVTSAPTTSATLASVSASGTGSTAAPAGSGSLSVTTTPAGAAVYVDGVQRGVSPATIPGLSAGSHTVLLKLDGYQDLSTPVPITAGTMNEFSTGLAPLPAGGTVVPATTAAGVPAAATKTASPGFEAAFGLAAIGTVLYLRNGSRR
jgi:hypothetical protein